MERFIVVPKTEVPEAVKHVARALYYEAQYGGFEMRHARWLKGPFYKLEYDTVDPIGRWEWDELYISEDGNTTWHSTVPEDAPKQSGYRQDVREGWVHLGRSCIVRDVYSVKFYAFREATIDPMCDALNGWYSVTTKWKAVFSDPNGEVEIATKDKQAIEKIFDIMLAVRPLYFEHEGTVSAAETARVKMETLANFLK